MAFSILATLNVRYIGVSGVCLLFDVFKVVVLSEDSLECPLTIVFVRYA